MAEPCALALTTVRRLPRTDTDRKHIYARGVILHIASLELFLKDFNLLDPAFLKSRFICLSLTVTNCNDRTDECTTNHSNSLIALLTTTLSQLSLLTLSQLS